MHATWEKEKTQYKYFLLAFPPWVCMKYHNELFLSLPEKYNVLKVLVFKGDDTY